MIAFANETGTGADERPTRLPRLDPSRFIVSFTLFALLAGFWGCGGSGSGSSSPADGSAPPLDGSVETGGPMDGGTDDSRAPDAATSEGGDATVPMLVLSLQPAHLVEDPGDTVTVTVNVMRVGFTGEVTFLVSPPLEVEASQPAPALDSTSTFEVSTPAATANGDYDVVLTGSSGSIVAQVHLPVHVGSFYELDGGSWTVPN